MNIPPCFVVTAGTDPNPGIAIEFHFGLRSQRQSPIRVIKSAIELDHLAVRPQASHRVSTSRIPHLRTTIAAIAALKFRSTKTVRNTNEKYVITVAVNPWIGGHQNRLDEQLTD